MKTWRCGNELAGRIECGRLLRFLGEFLFALDGLRGPYPKEWAASMHVEPVPNGRKGLSRTTDASIERLPKPRALVRFRSGALVASALAASRRPLSEMLLEAGKPVWSGDAGAYDLF